MFIHDLIGELFDYDSEDDEPEVAEPVGLEKKPSDNRAYVSSCPSTSSSGTESAELEAAETKPAPRDSNTSPDTNVRHCHDGQPAYWEHAAGSSCPCLTGSDYLDDSPSTAIAFIAQAWPSLQPHLREAIITLIHGSLNERSHE